jgi:hypothetical protein
MRQEGQEDGAATEMSPGLPSILEHMDGREEEDGNDSIGWW